MCIGFRLELADNFTEITSSAFEPFIGHHQGLFASVNVVLLKKILVFLLHCKNYVNNGDADDNERI